MEVRANLSAMAPVAHTDTEAVVVPSPAAEIGSPVAGPVRHDVTATTTASTRTAEVPAPAVSAPQITGINGVTSTAAGIRNGLVNMSIGTTWNGYRVVNDQPGLYTWTIVGRDFGRARGQVRLAGREVPILQWSNTSIRIDPSGAQLNPGASWNWGPQSTTLEVRTASGPTNSRSVQIVPAIRSRIYQQCTWHVARRRIEMGLAPSPTAYGGYSSITTSWVPRRGDQLKWGSSTHSAIIESVSRPTIQGAVKTYTLSISQYNASGNNEYSGFTTTFQVTGNRVTAFPKFRVGGTNATGFYR